MAAFSVTLTLANTNYNALTLVRAIDANFVDRANSLTIQSHDTNGAAIVSVAEDANLGAARRGYTLQAGAGMTYSGPRANLFNKWFRSDAAGSVVNIDVVR